MNAAGGDLESAETAEIAEIRSAVEDTSDVGKGPDRESLRRPGPEGEPSGLIAVRIRPPMI